MTNTELLVESIREFLEGRTPAVEFAPSFEYLVCTNGVRDPAQLQWAFDDLASVAMRFWEECCSQDPPLEVDPEPLRAAARATYDTAVDIIRQRGLHNIY